MTENIQKQKISPKFFFLSLGVLVSLITSIVSGLSLFFEILKKAMPDVLNATYQYGFNSYSYQSIRGFLATLIIAFPIFLALSYFWWKFVKKGLEGGNKVIFRWMINLILFLAIVVFAVDLIILVNYFVAGEITIRFILKVLATALVASLVWTNYYLILKEVKNKKKRKIVFTSLLALSCILFIALLVYSFMITGSPAKQRALRLDEKRVNNLQNIQWKVINYYQQKEKLPESLEALRDPLSGDTLPIDPEFQNGRVYEYAVKGDLTFELCATFSADTPKGWIEAGDKYYPVSASSKYEINQITGMNDSWDHGVGRACFERVIDPEIYKPYTAETKVY